MIDLAFLFTIVLFALITPKCKYRHINIALAGKFAVFIGLHYIIVSLGYTDGPYVDYYRAGLDFAFLFLFLYLRGYYIASLCFFMFMFHLINAQQQTENYTVVMITFQVAQLMGAVWGALDDFDTRCRIHNFWPFADRTNNNKS